MKKMPTFFQAIKAEDLRMLRYLIKQCPEGINRKNENGSTPLIYAGLRGEKEMMEELLSHPKTDIHAVTNDGWTAMHLAALRGYRNLVEVLLQKGADLNEKNQWGGTPLNEAARYERDEVVRLLIQRGAEIDHQAKSDDDVVYDLYFWVERGTCKVPIDFILEHGVFLLEETRKKYKSLRLEKLFV